MHNFDTKFAQNINEECFIKFSKKNTVFILLFKILLDFNKKYMNIKGRRIRMKYFTFYISGDFATACKDMPGFLQTNLPIFPKKGTTTIDAIFDGQLCLAKKVLIVLGLLEQ